MHKKIMFLLVFAALLMVTGCTVLTSPGQGYDSMDHGSYGGHSHH